MPRAPAPGTSQPSSRRWCFTLNNPLDDQKEELFNVPVDKVLYAVWQLERAPTTGTEHIQGYVILKRNQKLSFIKNLISNSVHAEIARGTAEENTTYCTKEEGRIEGPWTFGEPPVSQQGKRNEMVAVKEDLDAGKTLSEISQEHFGTFVRYYRGLTIYKSINGTPRDFKSQVIVLIGDTGIGKSWWASNYTKAATGAKTSFHPIWWDGYEEGQDIIINDFVGGIEFGKLLQILDNGPWMLESKGGTINFNPRRIVITSNIGVDRWYNWDKIRGLQSALERRLDYVFDVRFEAPPNVYYFTKEWTDRQNITDPYPFVDEIDWDAEIELDPVFIDLDQVLDDEQELQFSQASTWDNEDMGHTWTYGNGENINFN